MGTQEDVLESMPPVPSNFLLHKSVPQLDLLSRCSAFVTHGGANSMHEALSLGVPMVVVPLFGDQLSNAASVARCGAGFAFHNPLTSLTPASLSAAIRDLLTPSPNNTFRIASAKMSEKLPAAGGVAVAADAIMEHADRFEAREVLKPLHTKQGETGAPERFWGVEILDALETCRSHE